MSNPSESTRAETTPSAVPPTGSPPTGMEPLDSNLAPPKATPTNEETSSERQQAMARILTAFEASDPVEGKVIGWNKGGFHVSLDGVAGFCPRSQMELGNPKKPTRYLDKPFQFKILEIRDDGRRIVVSRSEILQQEREELLAETRKRLVPGAILEGRVTSLTDFGAFVDLGGIEGLVHLSQLSRRRIEHPREVLQKGQEVTVRLTKLENDGERLSLSMKDLEPDPWGDVETRFPSRSAFTGKVLRHSDFGLFVELEPGLEGLVHTSQLPLGMEMNDPSLAPGEEVAGWIKESDGERRRISLTLRELADGDPWDDVATRYREGTVVEGQVERIAPFGVFILLEPAITGLLPSSQLPRTQPGAASSYAAGQKVSVQVLAVDPHKRRISLALPGAQVSGTQHDYRDYMRKQREQQSSSSGLNAMAAAFAKMQRNG